ncbi:MAG: hypothetical protein H6705_16845 [Myxococcales bacterium]|nr:hypothetical protein [Myxococcales bacterium]
MSDDIETAARMAVGRSGPTCSQCLGLQPCGCAEDAMAYLARERRAKDPTRPCMACRATGRHPSGRGCACSGRGLLGRYPGCLCEAACSEYSPPEYLCAAAAAYRAAPAEGAPPAWREVAAHAADARVEVGVWPKDRYRHIVERSGEPVGFVDEVLGTFTACDIEGAVIAFDRPELADAVSHVLRYT